MTEASRQLCDNKYERSVNFDSVVVHISCRKSDTGKSNLASTSKKKERSEAHTSAFFPVKKKLRSDDTNFDFKELCLFCWEICNDVMGRKYPFNTRKRSGPPAQWNFNQI